MERDFGVSNCLFGRLVGYFRLFFDQFALCERRFIYTTVRRVPRFLRRAIGAIGAVNVPEFKLFCQARRRFMRARHINAMFLSGRVQVSCIMRKFARLLCHPSTSVFSVFRSGLDVIVLEAPYFRDFCVRGVIKCGVRVRVRQDNFMLIFRIR